VDLQSLLESVPTPSEADMAGRRKSARRYTLVFLRNGPAPRDDETRCKLPAWPVCPWKWSPNAMRLSFHAMAARPGRLVLRPR
jgi:hypothetical protein